MKGRKGILKKSLFIVMALSLVIGASGAAIFDAFASTSQNDNAVSVFDDGYELKGNWIWADTTVKSGQWISLRKTFDLSSVPEKFVARISADTKYWLWINGELAIYEGQLKLGDSSYTWYYDKEDLAKYLVEGENTIAVQVFYSGKASGSTINTRVPSFLFDAETESGHRVVSDTTWKAKLDPAYLEPVDLNNARNGEANIKYDAASEMIDADGNKWTDKNYDDSAWPYAVNQDEKIRNNRIYDDSGNVSGAYYRDGDPRRSLVLRSIPQLKVDDLSVFTSDGANETGTWTKTEGGYSFATLSLPSSYTMETVLTVSEPAAYSGGGSADAAIGICVCVTDANNLYMPQISFKQSTSFNGVRFKPHTRINGAWKSSTTDLTSSEVGKSLYSSGSYDYRYNTKLTVKVEVTPTTIKTYLNGYLVGTMTDTTLSREGTTIGFRQDRNELINVYSLKVTDDSGKEIYNAGINNLEAGDKAERFSLLTAENTSLTSLYNTVSKDSEGNSYVSIRNGRVAVNGKTSSVTYKIVNDTNVQGTPYLKVRSTNGGELISIESDAWKKGESSSIAHQYVTKAGEQCWEALGWMNGYEITFTIPADVQVLELGFRKSGYDTEATGSVTTDNAILNQLYQEAYDTLYVCMRDSYMDCPDRERTQWWGDAVVNMQQAAYAMDENAALLYAKTLTQALGFVQENGELPSKIALGRPDLELPMQSLAGVQSFWQYYMYYGDREFVASAFPTLYNYLTLWDISESGVITHRDGNWNWYDWGSHPDTVIIENCWYYEALKAVLNISALDGSGATNTQIDLIKDRMGLIERNFDTLYWNYEKNAYYNSTDNGVADDRANALAIYTGLADRSRCEGILNVLVNTYNAGPYMEKYVLEAMYMMGADEEAITRTLARFTPFTEDGYPTLPEIWLDQTLYGGDETKNHAWTGAPLSMLYMYNAGITTLTPGFETIKVRPQLGMLNSISATVERGSGKIYVSVEKTSDKYVLTVTIPTGADGGLIYVPRIQGIDTMITLDGNVVFTNGAANVSCMPNGVSYADEDVDFIGFNVVPGTYTFVAEKNTVDEKDEYSFTVNSVGGGSLTVNGTTVTSYPYTLNVAKGSVITVVATPNEKHRLVALTGSYPENVISDSSVTKTYTVNSDASIGFVFEEKTYANKLLTISTNNNEMARYAISVYVNGTLVSLPYTGSFIEGAEVKINVIPSGKNNYDVSINGNAIEEALVKLTDNANISVSVSKKATVVKKTIASVVASDTTSNNSWKAEYLYDGIIVSKSQLGYTTGWKTNSDVSSNPYTLTFDLGSVQTINQVSMFPRFDSWSADSTLSCNYPVDFTISVSENGTDYRTVVNVQGCENPRFKQQFYSFEETSARFVKLTVTKLGIPAYNDGSNNDHYRLQLSEFEIYYNGESSAVTTEYGIIPSEYTDVDAYPIVVFKADGTFVGGYSTWKEAAAVIGIAEKTDSFGKGDNSIVLFRKNSVHSTATGNIHSFHNNIVIDLGGNTVTLDKQNFIGLYIYRNETAEITFGNITIKNGKFINKAENTAPVCLDGGAAVKYPVNYSVNFENVTFTSVNSDKVLYGALRTWASKGTANINLNVKMTDCTFDYTGASTNAGMLNLSYNGDAKTVFNVVIEGGVIVANSNSSFNFVEKDAADSIVFAKNSNGEYIKLQLSNGSGAPSSNKVYVTENGIECVFVKAYSDGSNDIYKLYPSVMVGYKIKTSVTLYSNFVYNIYIPVANVNGFTVNGMAMDYTTEVIDNVEYYVVKVDLAAGETLADIKLCVTLKSGDTTVDANWTLNVYNYTKAVLGGDYNETTKTLMKDMLVYASAAHTYFENTEAVAEKLAEIKNLLGDYAAEMPTGEAKAPADKTYFTDVAVYLGEVPSFRFYLASGYTAADFTFKVGNRTVDVIASDDGKYVEIVMYAYMMLDDVTFTVKSNGETGTYNLYSYLDYAKNVVKDANLVAIVEALAKYSVSAKAYRNSVINK